MNYYFEHGIVLTSEIELNETNGHGSAEVLTEAQFNFGMANKGASLQEILAMELNSLTFEQKKANKLNEFESYIQSVISNGYLDTDTNYRLFLSEEDQTNYTKLKAIILDFTDNDVVKLGTMSGWVDSTKSVVYPLLQRYGTYALELYYTFSNIKIAIQYSQNEDQLNNITW